MVADALPEPNFRPPAPRPVPRVAVIVPAYGVAHLVGEALDSLLAQTLADWECLVIDDGAPDDVAGAVAPYLGDPRIRFLHTSNHGVSGARNRAIRETSAPLIALLDGDDLFRPEYLETMCGLLEANADIRLATCNARMFGAVPRDSLCINGKQGSSDGLHGTLADVLSRSFNVYIGTTFRRADFEAVGGFDESMAQSEDLDLWVRLMMLGGHARFVDAVMGDYRIREGSASANAGLLLLGNIKLYEKARARPDCDGPTAALIDRLIQSNREALAFEHAIDKITAGETKRGLAELRTVQSQVSGPVWTLAFALWRFLPALARPMLSWRRKAHSRGAVSTGILSSFSIGRT